MRSVGRAPSFAPSLAPPLADVLLAPRRSAASRCSSAGWRQHHLRRGLADRFVRNVHVGENGPSSLEEPSVPRRRMKPVELPRPPMVEKAAEAEGVSGQRLRGERGNLGGADGLKSVERNQQRQRRQPDQQQGRLRPNVMGQVLSVAIPALGTVLADPLMSLVDTACVGQLSSVELAALGPNTAIFNFVFQLFTFLGLSTANIIACKSLNAEGLTKQEVQDRRDESESIMCFALTLAAVVGMASAAMLFAAGPVLLRALGSSPEIIPFALPYLRIRALASPAVMLTMVAQGACLGQQDMWTPLKVVLVSGLINLFGDMHLILNLKMGTVGAALATTGAQYAGAIFFLLYLRRGGGRGAGLKLRWKGLPSWKALKPMFDVGQVLLARIGATMAGYTAITSAATYLGTVAVASHQVMLQVFWLLSYFPEPFSLTAQTLIAKHNDDRGLVRTMSYLLLRLGTYTGAALALVLGAVMSFVPFVFSSDPVVVSTFQSLIPQAMISVFLSSASMMCDGVSIGSGQIRHLPGVMTMSMLMAVGWVYLSKGMGHGLGSVWWGLVAFFAGRALFHALHIRLNWNRSPFGLYQKGDQDQQQEQSTALDPVMNPQLA